MNSKGFTLIELIAVVVIMAIIALIATPNIVGMLDNGKKTDYISYANEMISKATYMYKQEKYKKEFENGNTIKLENIKGIENYDDPYGSEYDRQNSYVQFVDPSSGQIGERKVKVYLESIESEDKCRHFLDATESDISENNISKVQEDCTSNDLSNNDLVTDD